MGRDVNFIRATGRACDAAEIIRAMPEDRIWSVINRFDDAADLRDVVYVFAVMYRAALVYQAIRLDVSLDKLLDGAVKNVEMCREFESRLDQE